MAATTDQWSNEHLRLAVVSAVSANGTELRLQLRANTTEQSQKMAVAAGAMEEKNVVGQRS